MSDDGKLLANLLKRKKAGMSDPITGLIFEYMLKRDDSPNRYWKLPFTDMEPRPRPPGRLSPSMAGGCQRQAAFKFVGAPGNRKIDAQLQMIFDDGNIRHIKWGWMFLDMQEVLGKDRFEVLALEMGVSIPELYMSGSLDCIALINGVKWVVDFKGANTFAFNGVALKDQPKEGHPEQLVSYMRAAKIRRGLLLYENKNNSEIKAHVVILNKETWNPTRFWFSSVVESVREEKLPARHEACTKGSTMASQCAFKKLCYGYAETHGEEKLERRAYRDFPGIDTQWELGNEQA